jgi:hypothetical protein
MKRLKKRPTNLKGVPIVRINHFLAAARASVAIGAVLFVSACSVNIVRPADQSTAVPTSVASEITLPAFYKPNTFRASLNDRDVTSSYTVNTSNSTANGTLTGLAPGSYVLDVGACWGLDVLFVTQPQTPTTGCSQARSSFTVVQPRLALSFASGSVVSGDPVQATVQATPLQPNAVNVTLASSNTSAVSSGSLTVQASTPSATAALSSSSAGVASVTASATGYTSASANVAVRPRLTQLSPASVAAGATISGSGAGYVAPVNVRFGMNGPTVTATNVTATQFNVVVPATLMPGNVQVTVRSNGQDSDAFTLAVAGPAPITRAMFRSNADSIETIRFAQATPFVNSSFVLATPLVVSTSAGKQVVGLCRNGATLARASSNAVELFTVGGTAVAPTLTAGATTPLPSGLTGVGSDCVFAPGTLVRGTDSGLETIDPTTSPLARQGGRNTGGSSSVGVSLAVEGTSVFRSSTTGLETYSVATPSAPVLQSNVITNMSGSSQGTALVWLVPGTTLVRATSAGIDLLDVTTPTAPTRPGVDNSGRQSSTGVDAAILGTGASARVVRATDEGIEVYDVSNTAQPQRCFFRNADQSATGVGLVVSGTVAFRATDDTIEAYDLSSVVTATCPAMANNTAIPAPIQQPVLPATTGVALIAF